MIPVITVDGPSGAGKGTICQKVADNLGWHILDSGSLYRLTALAATQDAADFTDEEVIGDIARQLDVVFESTDNGLRILLRGEDATETIRKEDMGMAASKIASITKVRDALLERQRVFAQNPGLVADGRDMGTTVFPNAKLKVFMTASCEERAKRRYNQLKEKGINANLAALVTDLKVRDEQDANRAVSPLKPADDAIMLDTTEMSIEQVTEKVLEMVKQVFS